MIKKLMFVSLTVLLGVWGSTANAAPGRGVSTQCYVWSNSASTAIGTPYNPSAMYSFNANGNAATYNSVTRTAVGNYNVTCKGVGGSGWATAGGHVQVTAYGATTSQCKIAGWSSGGADFNGTVRCYTPAGAPVNSQFDLLFIW
jgi:hypothetical protein